MSPLLYQLLTTGDLKLCQLMEDDDNSELPPIHTVFLTMRKAVYAIIFNVHHTSYCRLTDNRFSIAVNCSVAIIIIIIV